MGLIMLIEPFVSLLIHSNDGISESDKDITCDLGTAAFIGNH